MVRVFGLTVTRNEADRYLQSCLAWHLPMFESHLVYDDQSEDRTEEVVMKAGVHLTRRPDGVPTFMQHEGRFRQDSLLALEECFALKDGDWVMVVDADEFLVSGDGLAHKRLQVAASEADAQGCKSVIIPRPELWSLDPPMERTDGYWGDIRCTRLFRFEKGGRIKDVPMGCGNEPTYINHAPVARDAHGLKLLHVGYVEQADRQEKYDRYSSLRNHGHNAEHIRSILGRPTLRPIKGVPSIWRGIRESE